MKNRYIETDHFREELEGGAIRIVDGGARGGLFEPFEGVETPLEVYAFEPDPDAQKRTPDPLVSTRFVEAALWKDTSGVDVHIAAEPSTSSVYPPNLEFLEPFEDRIGVPARSTQQVVKVPSTSIDEAAGAGVIASPDFIKLDIHSSEYEALLGARRALEESAVGVLVETWHAPVHACQYLHADVEQLLNEHGFYLFHLRKASVWDYLDEGRRGEGRRHVGSEALFLKDDRDVEGVEHRRALLLVGLADLFGYPNYGIHATRRFAAQSIFSEQQAAEMIHRLRRLRNARRIQATREELLKSVGSIGKHVYHALREYLTALKN